MPPQTPTLPGVARRVLTGVLECGPAGFQEHALLRIHEFGFAHGDAEESRIEVLGILEQAARFDVVGIRNELRRNTCRAQLVVVEGRDAFDAVDQILPEGVNRLGAGKTQRHADDGDTRDRRRI